MSKRMTPLLLAMVLAVSAGAAHAREAHIRHPFLAQQPKAAPEEVLLAVEIPAGSFTKYEINDEGLVFVDRFQSMPVAYPAFCRTCGRVTRSSGNFATFSTGLSERFHQSKRSIFPTVYTPVRAPYWPVNKAARVGWQFWQ